MSTMELRRETFDIGRVARETFGVIGRNIATFGLLAILLAGLPQLVIGFIRSSVTAAATAGGDPGMVAMSGLLMVVFGLITLGFSGVLQAAVVHGSISDLGGRKASLGDLLGTGLRYAIPAILVTLLYGVGVGLGTLLLIVPGIIVACVFVAALPMRVAERTTIIGAFSRSSELTKGSRWGIFGLIFIYGVIIGVIDLVMLGLSGGLTRAGMAGNLPAVIVVQAINATVNALIGAAGVASIYVELRTIKDGAAPASLASVFD